jgi:hypothetical protein
VGLLQSLGDVSLWNTFALVVIVTALRSDSRLKLDSILGYEADIPLVIAKSNESGILSASVGLYVGSPVGVIQIMLLYDL